MSTEDTNTTTYAKLVRGRIYILGTKEFEFDNWVEVSDADRDWLEAHAVDQVTVEGENEHQARQKFVFEVRPRDAGETAAKASSSPRTRSR